MHSARVLMAATLLFMLSATAANAFVFTGSLTSADGGIIASPAWKTVTLGWTVTMLPNQTWQYDYDFSVSQGAAQQKNISHILIEASLDFTEASDILSTNWMSSPPQANDVEVQQWTSQQGNPDIPGPMFGIKFNTVNPLPSTPQQSTGTHWLIQFVSTRAPVWGDFYAKNGQTGGVDLTAWNAGFLLPDPIDPPADGSIDNKILRPDSVIPEASAAALASLALPMLGAFRLVRRRRA